MAAVRPGGEALAAPGGGVFSEESALAVVPGGAGFEWDWVEAALAVWECGDGVEAGGARAGGDVWADVGVAVEAELWAVLVEVGSHASRETGA